ncbi:MAG: ATP-binding protein [Thermomicrobiales bacterium]
MERPSIWEISDNAGKGLVGRDRELAVLRDALSSALNSRGSLVLISGEAGVGKTTIAEALLAEATAQGALALVGRCYDLAETPPYGPWAGPSPARRASMDCRHRPTLSRVRVPQSNSPLRADRSVPRCHRGAVPTGPSAGRSALG